ncbi:hypothetical protein EW093_10195 [Thiospirochaeta perfilievii]|uniref:Uncharacterized protein n=1 Tax=Thiospirochaeta perfilievii TaxID=252967 RepID=A0A5C1QA91_9SPIO|nr:hypothetical protein [Thiospirochaeta perfilievii]QEN05063.1 hypothetical protein EW093_10195 [Thiospirochaeta perfilievii]
MPLERKILLSILLTLIFLLSGYHLYNNYYLVYKDNAGKIDKYQTLIDNYKPPIDLISKEDLESLDKRLEELKSYFTDSPNLKNMTNKVKADLLNSGLTISQYSQGEESVNFSFTGTKKDLETYLNRVRVQNKFYYYPMFNLRMIDNENLSGNMEVMENVKSYQKNRAFYLDSPRKLEEINEQTTNILEPFGVQLFIATPEPLPLKQEEELKSINKIEILETDKFSFVGLLKKEDGVITMFKERNHGRIYRFKSGATISDWKYLGQKNSKFLFEKDGIKYEVLN